MTTPLHIAVEDLEVALRLAVRRMTTKQLLELTVRLLALRRAAGMPARLTGPAGRLRVVASDGGPEAA